MFSDVNVGEVEGMSEDWDWTGVGSTIEISIQNEEELVPKDQAKAPSKGEKILPKLLSNTKGNANVAKRSAKDMSKLKPNGDEPKASQASKVGDKTTDGQSRKSGAKINKSRNRKIKKKSKNAKQKESARPTLKTSRKQEAKKKKKLTKEERNELRKTQRNERRKTNRNLLNLLRIHLPGCSHITEQAVLLERAIMFILFLLNNNDEDHQE